MMHRDTRPDSRHRYPRLRASRIAGVSSPLTVRRPEDAELPLSSGGPAPCPRAVAGGAPPFRQPRTTCGAEDHSVFPRPVSRAKLCAEGTIRAEVDDALNVCDHYVTRHLYPGLRRRCVSGAADSLSAAIPQQIVPRHSQVGRTLRPRAMADQSVSYGHPLTTFIATRTIPRTASTTIASTMRLHSKVQRSYSQTQQHRNNQRRGCTNYVD